MPNVLIDRDKLDVLANAISNKSGEALTLTLDEMVDAVDGIETGGGGITPTGNIDITSAGTTDVTNYATATVASAMYDSGFTTSYTTESGVRKWQPHAYVDVDDSGWIGNNISIDGTKYNAIPTGTSVTPTESAQTIGGHNYMMEGAVTVNAIPSNYVGSGITQRTSSDLTANGNTVTAPSGYYGSNATKTIASANWGGATETITKDLEDESWIYSKTYPNFVSGYQATAVETTFMLDLEDKSVVPSANQQVITPTDNGCYLNSVTVSAMPSGTEGTPTATKSAVSNHAVTVTPSVTNSAGYIGGGTHSGTAVTVSASELVSGTLNVNSSGIINVTNYENINVPAMTLPVIATSSYSGTRKAGINAARTPSYLNIPTGYNSTEQYYEIFPLNIAPLSVTENGTYNASDYDIEGFGTVTVSVSGGGGGDVQVYSSYNDSMETAASSITFNNLLGEPTSFIVYAATNSNITTPTRTPYKVIAVVYDGTSYHGQTITNINNAQVSYDSGSFGHVYSNGTLTITSTGAYFQPFPYSVLYTYGGTAGNIHTADVQVGSGATSITFTGLDDEPLYWSCIFKSNFSTSNGYQRVIYTAEANYGIEGACMDSSAHCAEYENSYWTSSYNNGSLTITSQGTNAGGYFHQPGYYQLTYAISGDQSLQTKTITPTASTQNVMADSGYTALKKVVVNPIPSSYVQPITTIGATTYRASTSSQTIQSGTYHSAAATIAAVTQSNLIADNIKSGTTISISNGQSNLWSVTGTYTGGGGGGSTSIDTKTVTASNRPTTLSFTSMKGEPTTFILRCTSSMSRSSNSSYYYVAVMRYNGTNTTGNCWRMSNGNWTNITSGYSWSYSGTTLTLTSSGTTTTSPGCFYPGNYELVYTY